MATTSKTKKATTKASTTKRTTKKQSVKEQLENLDKALENIEGKDVIELLPDEVKADIVDETAGKDFEEPKEIDVDEEVKKIFEDSEPSEDVKKQIEEFETGKEKFNEEMTKHPEKAEETVSKELKRVQELKKKVETMQKGIDAVRDSRNRNDIFTNLWNGVNYGL